MKSKIFLLFLLMPVMAFGQKPRPMHLVLVDYQQFHLGYSVGVNWMGLTMIPQDSFLIELNQHPGININLITDLRLSKYLNLRFTPGIQFSQRDISVNRISQATDTTFNINASWGPVKVESVYLDLPFLIKYRAERVNNFAPYVIAGIAPRFDLTGGEIQNWKPVKRLLRAFDFYPELGCGLDFYTPRVKVALELKFSVGIRNIYQSPGDDPQYSLYANGVDRILSKMLILAVHVENSL